MGTCLCLSHTHTHTQTPSLVWESVGACMNQTCCCSHVFTFTDSLHYSSLQQMFFCMFFSVYNNLSPLKTNCVSSGNHILDPDGLFLHSCVSRTHGIKSDQILVCSRQQVRTNLTGSLWVKLAWCVPHWLPILLLSTSTSVDSCCFWIWLELCFPLEL